MASTSTMIKEEPVEESYPISGSIVPDDEIIASYDIFLVNNSTHKVMSVAGLSNVLENSKKYDVSIRTDLKEIKVTSKLDDDSMAICYTKETNVNLDKQFYAVKLSRETGNAYFVPVTSMHSISFLDESNKSNKEVDEQNVIFEDCFKTPHPSRNKHDQLCVEMKSYLYKPLKCIVHQEYVKHFMVELFGSKRQASNHILNLQQYNKLDNNKPMTPDPIDIVSCPHWQLNRVNLCDIKRMDVLELQIEGLLRKGQVLTFAEILEILCIEPCKLLNVLPTIAILVLGNWVIKSNLLYKINVFHDGETRQNHYKDLIAARDFLLWNLVTKRKIIFADIYSKFKKSLDHEQILTRLTIRSGVNDPICFILPEDTDFIKTYASSIANLHKNSIRLLEKHKAYMESEA